MEGISHEAASLAGHLGLGRLLAFYDDNHITIDGPTELAYNDNPVERFEAYGWRVRNLGEMANDVDGLEAAIREALDEPADGPDAKPTLLVLRSHIGWPSPKLTDTAAAHGSPFGADEIKVTKEILGLPPDQTFWVPDEVREFYGQQIARGAERHAAWTERFAAWKGDRAAWDAAQAGHGLPGWADDLPGFEAGTKLATRHAINQCIDATAAKLPGLLAGSADLTGNNGVKVKGAEMQSRETPGGIQVHYGIREHGMGSAMNGMAQHGGVLPLGGTFFCFSDYMRPAVRLAALTGTHVIYSWTHDSIGLGEDGPTHQPVEHLASLRAMPGLSIVRPADANETAQAWRLAVEADGPVGLVLTRQDVPVLAATAERAAEGVPRGAYVLVDSDGPPQIVLVGTGSEVQLCVAAAATLAGSGVRAQVVSFPSWDHFERQPRGLPGHRLPARRAGAEHRGRLHLRMGPLRRRRHRDRPLRCVGPGRGRHGEVRVHRRPRGGAGPGPPGRQRWLTRDRRRPAVGERHDDEGSCPHDPTAGPLRDRRPEPLAGQPAPRLARGRPAGRAAARWACAASRPTRRSSPTPSAARTPTTTSSAPS